MPKKGLYLDEKNQYQAECLKLLDACGHKQGKFLGILIHDFIMRTGIDLEKIDKKTMQDYIRLMEVQYKMGFNSSSIAGSFQSPTVIIKEPLNSQVKGISEDPEDNLDGDDEIISDIEGMEEALGAFNIE